jgi:cell surface protein SprA
MGYAITTSMELGKFFPDKAKVTIPVYYSYSKDIVKPKYNPLDTDMEMDDALDAARDENERDSIESIALSKHVSTNFSVSNARVGIKSKKHPMPYDPGNFSFSYSHAHERTTGKTTVWDTEDRWRGSLNYTYSPVYKTWEPFKKMKGKSKWLDMPKAFGINYLPQSISFNTDISRTYNELLERDLENTENPCLPITYNEQFLWNREFQLRWDFTKNLHMSFQSATHAQIEEPYSDLPLNKALYPDRYSAWKDSIWTSILHWGIPLDYQQSFQASYQLPLNKIPIFDWITADASYNATYSWLRGSELDNGKTLGNTISNNRNLNINGAFNMETLYNHFPFLKKTNERFKKQQSRNNTKNTKKPKQPATKKDNKKDSDKKGEKDAELNDAKQLSKNKNTYQREIKLLPDSAITVQHGKKSKRLYVTARNKQGKTVQLKWKVIDQDKIKVWLPSSAFEKKDEKGKKKEKKEEKADSLLAQTDSIGTQTDSLQAKAAAPKAKSIQKLNKRQTAKAADTETAKADGIELKISIMPKQPIEELWWYSPAQYVARGLMMIRSINLSYRNQRSMMVPGFLPNIGDAFGQRTGGVLAPGLDFAFGLAGDSYLQKAIDNEWLLMRDSTTSTPSTSSTTEDLQLKATLEPVRDLKIDLNASRTSTRSSSVQYMYEGMPTTLSGSFNMTTISIQSALEGMGDANNGYRSTTFNKFRERISEYQQRVQAQYAGATPRGVSDATIKPVDQYSADVLVPAFLSTYTLGGSSSLDIFPALLRMLPNWTLRYAGLAKLPWIRDHFKSVNINHGYRSVYSVGSYNSFSSWTEYMGDLGFVKDADGSYQPSTMYNVPTVSINEAFSPLLGLDVTLNNNLTAKIEYRTTRVLNLSITSVQINEALSKDFVIGLGYKFQNLDVFSLFGGTKSRKIKGNRNRNNKNSDDKKQDDKKQSSSTAKSGVNHDLNTRFDISFRKQAAITRDITTGVSSASSGNSALKITFSADYTLSRYLTLTAYYDRQTNTPLLSSSSYPTTTQDFGVSLKFSLTR